LQALIQALDRPSSSATSLENADTLVAIKSLYQVRSYFDVPLSRFVSDVSEAIQEIEPFTPHELPLVIERLTALLSVESFTVATRGLSLLQEYERKFCTARILTDARPIFSQDPKVPPTAVLIIHTLRISYHETSDLKETYIAMDAQDVSELKQILIRAEDKAKALESVFKRANVRVVDARGE